MILTYLRKRGFVILFFLVFLITYHLSLITFVSAADATVSASQADQLQALVKEIEAKAASKAAQLKSEVDKKLTNKAFIGTVLSATDSKITIQTKTDTKTITINEYTVYEVKGSKKPSIKDISQKDNIAALGDLDDKGGLVAKKIVELPDLKKYSNDTFWGKIQTITPNSLGLRQKDQSSVTVNVSTETVYINGGNEAVFKDLSFNNFVVVVGQKKANTINAAMVYIIPTGGYIITKPKIASASASVSPSPVVKKKL